MTVGEMASQTLMVRVLDFTRAKDAPAMSWRWPWDVAEQLPAAEVARLTAELERRSAFNRN